MIDKKNPFEKIQSEFKEGMSLAKCRKCGCMKETLENIQTPFTLLKFHDIPSEELLKSIKLWQGQMETIKYACLGCKHCFPAVATNIFNEMFPEANETNLLSCAIEETKNKKWFPIANMRSAMAIGETRQPIYYNKNFSNH